MKAYTDVTVKVQFDNVERKMLKRATYADGLERHFGRQSDVDFSDLIKARAKALQPSGHPHTSTEMRALAEAVSFAIEAGEISESSYEEEPWGGLAKSLLDAAGSISDIQGVAHSKRSEIGR